MNCYQIAFIFTADDSSLPLSAFLALTDSNTFLSGANYIQQVLPYTTSSTPPLVNLSFAAKQIQFVCGPSSISTARQGLEVVTYVSGEGTSLQLNLGNSSPTFNMSYRFLGGVGSGQLVVGNNSILFPTA